MYLVDTILRIIHWGGADYVRDPWQMIRSFIHLVGDVCSEEGGRLR